MQARIIERTIIELNEKQKKMLISGWGKETLENTITESIIYISDGLRVKGYISYPINKSKDKLPCIMWNRGGIKDRGFIDDFTACGIFGKLASEGFVVFASMYRGSVKGEGEEEFGGVDVNDIINLADAAIEIPYADTSLWGIEGWSRGGMMTFLVLRRDPRFKVAVVTGAISDLTTRASEDNSFTEFFTEVLPDPATLEQELAKRSCVNFVNELPKIPYLIMHGTNDTVVSPSQSLVLAQKLQDLKHFYRLIMFENGDHFLKHFRREVDQHKINWFKKYLS